MSKKIRHSQKGFTLIELLTVIAIIGILAAIIIPGVGKVKQTANRAADQANLRSIGQAALLYAQSNKDQLPGARIDTATFSNARGNGGSVATPKLVAGALAMGGGLETGKLWVSKADDTTTKENDNANVGNVLNSNRSAIDPGFDATNLAFGFVAGLNSNMAATTPVAFTRGIASQADGRWSATTGTYKDDGGHIVFVGGNVAFYKNLGTTAIAGELVGSNGAPTNDIRATVNANRSVIFIEENTAGGSGASAAPNGS